MSWNDPNYHIVQYETTYYEYYLLFRCIAGPKIFIGKSGSFWFWVSEVKVPLKSTIWDKSSLQLPFYQMSKEFFLLFILGFIAHFDSLKLSTEKQLQTFSTFFTLRTNSREKVKHQMRKILRPGPARKTAKTRQFSSGKTITDKAWKMNSWATGTYER